MSEKMEVDYSTPVSGADTSAATTATATYTSTGASGAATASAPPVPPVVIVLRGHGESLPNNPPVSQKVISLFSDAGQITFLRKSRVGLQAFQNERNWQQLFEIIQSAKASGRNSYEDLLRIITRTAIGVPDIGDHPSESNPFRIAPISHGIEHLYTFYESEPKPQNSRAIGIYDTDELNKLITPGEAPSGSQCGFVLQEVLLGLPLGKNMPIEFDNSILNAHPELRNSPFRKFTLSEIAIDLQYRYPGRKIILVEVACRGGEQLSGLSTEQAGLAQLTSEMGEMTLLSPDSDKKTRRKRKAKNGGRTLKNKNKNKKKINHRKK